MCVCVCVCVTTHTSPFARRSDTVITHSVWPLGASDHYSPTRSLRLSPDALLRRLGSLARSRACPIYEGPRIWTRTGQVALACGSLDSRDSLSLLSLVSRLWFSLSLSLSHESLSRGSLSLLEPPLSRAALSRLAHLLQLFSISLALLRQSATSPSFKTF